MSLSYIKEELLAEIVECTFLLLQKNLTTYYKIKVSSDEEKCKSHCADDFCNTFYHVNFGTFFTDCGNKQKFDYFLCKKLFNHVKAETNNKSKNLKTIGLTFLCLFILISLLVVGIYLYRKYNTTGISNTVNLFINIKAYIYASFDLYYICHIRTKTVFITNKNSTIQIPILRLLPCKDLEVRLAFNNFKL